MKTQYQFYCEAEARSGRLNEAFADLMRNQDITRSELQALIAKRPEVYGRFAGYLDKLPQTLG